MAKLSVPFFLLLAFSAGVGCCMHAEAAHPGEKATLVGELMSDTVALVHRDKDGDIATFCTAVWIGKNQIITADHCAKAPLEARLGVDLDDGNAEDLGAVESLEQGAQINFVTNVDATGVYQEPKVIRDAVVSKFDHVHDLALLTVADPPPHHVALLASVTPAIGEDIHVMGHPSALAWTYMHGYVSSYREENFRPMKHKRGPWLQLAVPAWHGNSGGGAFNAAGELIGICSFLAPAPETIFFVHLETVRGFLSRPVTH